MMHLVKKGTKIEKNTYLGLPQHVGGPASCHNRARIACEDFKNQRASVTHRIEAHSANAERKYETV
jgi:hypothetical protein